MADMSDVLSMDRLPAMPAALARAIPLLLDPESEWSALEKVVCTDEALTATILRVANSVQFGSPGRQFDLRRAMARLGRDTLRCCILEQQMSRVVAGGNEAFGLQRGAMWRSALAGAIAAEELAHNREANERSLAFMCGLLRDIGKLALNVRYGSAYFVMISEHARDGSSFIEAERRALGFDHAQVGGALARRWLLPERVAAAIECHHEPPGPGPSHDVLFDTVHAADMICRWAGFGIGMDGLEYRFATHVREAMKLDRRSAEYEIAVVWDRIREAEEALGESGKQGAAA